MLLMVKISPKQPVKKPQRPGMKLIAIGRSFDMADLDQKRELALDLHKIGALKFGEFTFKSGIVSPIYVDLRLFISYPEVLKKVTKLYAEQLKDLKYDRLAGVAYAALPIAGAIS